MGTLNQVVLFGHLGADPELRETRQGKAVTNLTVATNASFTNERGEREEQTDWHQVVVWGAQAEACADHLSKGRAVLVTGRLQSRKWTDDDGADRTTTEIVATRVEFVGKKKEPA